MSAPTRFSPAKDAQHGEQLAAGQAAGLRGAGAGRVRRVEHVDVDRDVDGTVADPLRAMRSTMPAHAEVVGVGGGDHLEAELGVLGQVMLGVQRAADADVQAAPTGRAGLPPRPAGTGVPWV